MTQLVRRDTSEACQSRLIPMSEVCNRIGYSRWWVRGAILEGKFPKPLDTGYRSPRWLESEIETWISQLVAKRDRAAV